MQKNRGYLILLLAALIGVLFLPLGNAKEKDKMQFEYRAIRDLTIVDSERRMDICLINQGGEGELINDALEDDHILVFLPSGLDDDDLMEDPMTAICTPLEPGWICELDTILAVDNEDEEPDGEGQDWLVLNIRPDGTVQAEKGETFCFRVDMIDVNTEMGEVPLIVEQYIEKKRAEEPLNEVIEVFKTDALALDINHDDLGGIREDQHHPRYTDDEAFQAVLDRDGPGSGLDADTVDGHEGADLEESNEIDADIAAHAAIADAHHAKTTSFSELIDQAADAQIPDDITINYALTAGNSDMVDGLHAGAFMPAGTDLWVNTSGDTMTGALTLPGDPAANLHAATKQYVDSKVAAVPGVPSGYSILGETDVAPPGYTYTGMMLTTNSFEQWETKAPMPVVHGGGPVSAMINGKFYVAGGYYASTRTDEYDPLTNTWVQKENMPTGRFIMAGAAINGKLYVAGGSKWGAPQSANEEYDPVTDTWSVKAPMPTPRYGCAGAVLDGKFYVVGGGSYGLTTNQAYDPVTNSWATRAPMPTARSYLAAAALDGKLYAVGGRSTTPGLQTNEEYDPVTNAWSSKAPIPDARFECAAATLFGKVHVMGGREDGWNWVPSHYSYDPATDVWTEKLGLDRPDNTSGITASAYQNTIFVFGPNDECERYATDATLYVHRRN